MKKLFLTCIILCMALYAGAQCPSSYFSLGAGSTMPIGAYAGTASISDNAYAKAGSVVALDFAKYYGPLGFAATISFGQHKLNQAALNNAFHAGGYSSPGYTDSSKWMASTAMFGPTYGFSCGRFGIDFRVLGGFYFAKAPDTRIQNEESIDRRFWKFNNNWYDCIGALGWQCGASVRYNMCKRWLVYIRTTYCHAKPSYEIKSNYSSESGKVQETYRFTQRTSMVDVLLGIGYRFHGKAGAPDAAGF